MKLIAEGNFSDGFGSISNVRFFEGEKTNKIIESYRGSLEIYEVDNYNRRWTGKLFIYPFYNEDTPFHCRFSEMLNSIRDKGFKN